MLPHTHFLFPFMVSLILSKLNVLSLEFVFLAGLIGALVDIDHYIEHIIHAKTKRFSFIATWNNSIKLHRFHQRSFIHDMSGAALLTIVIALVGIYHRELSLAIAIGYYSHLFLDYMHLRQKEFMRFKIHKTYFKESRKELYVDIILIIAILLIY